MQSLILTLHVITAVSLVGLILIQHGKGAEVGASFGSGASQTIFGSQGSGTFLSRITATLAIVFFITSLTLGYFSNRDTKLKSLDELINKVQPAQQQNKTDDNSDIPKLP